MRMWNQGKIAPTAGDARTFTGYPPRVKPAAWPDLDRGGLADQVDEVVQKLTAP
ncbi:MAG TPA: hypothetical protein VFT91_04715 [Dehalococcoidia bacterium]|nr:hypothetical protein [Dehalococcoidia bacterium]